ncbi:hypothetical protein C8Z91_17645 [Paenibacillus elgii]|uniref:Uncharacterized protein n=1 Tax=Paenibacillus elgii TaxID=189691 RepID=A0A2T6G1C8_9BACL|nr:hypothetical protein [Paenibacillus elgii]PUA37957.1 hypothetical protein C8Z91_17645 [Paenibacillus elgii]
MTTYEPAQFEMFRDPFKMLIVLLNLVAEQQGMELDYEKVPSFENETFLIRHANNGDISDERIPNFIYKKDGTEITWYHYLGRDIYCSKDLSREEYNKMFVDCMASLYQLNG